jgi:hypothetical protein
MLLYSICQKCYLNKSGLNFKSYSYLIRLKISLGHYVEIGDLETRQNSKEISDILKFILSFPPP